MRIIRDPTFDDIVPGALISFVTRAPSWDAGVGAGDIQMVIAVEHCEPNKFINWSHLVFTLLHEKKPWKHALIVLNDVIVFVDDT